MTNPVQLPRRYTELAPQPPEGPIQVSSLVPRAREVELEIGFGRGLFLIERAQFLIEQARCASDVALLGVEIKAKWVWLVHQRCARLGLHNVRVFHGHILDVLPRLGPGACLRRVFVNFPDPWWKRRHAKRRLLGAPLLLHLARLLVVGGELFVQTDVEERAQQLRVQLALCSDFELAGRDGLVPSNPYGACSNREKRAIADGLPVYRVLARRVLGADQS